MICLESFYIIAYPIQKDNLMFCIKNNLISMISLTFSQYFNCIFCDESFFYSIYDGNMKEYKM
mgnify:CR=1 FL=1